MATQWRHYGEDVKAHRKAIDEALQRLELLLSLVVELEGAAWSAGERAVDASLCCGVDGLIARVADLVERRAGQLSVLLRQSTRS